MREFEEIPSVPIQGLRRGHSTKRNAGLEYVSAAYKLKIEAKLKLKAQYSSLGSSGPGILLFHTSHTVVMYVLMAPEDMV